MHRQGVCDKHEDSAGEHIPSGVLLDEWCNEDGTDTLCGLVQTGKHSSLVERRFLDALLLGLAVVKNRGHGNDGAVECLKTELVAHDAGNVDEDGATLQGGVHADRTG